MFDDTLNLVFSCSEGKAIFPSERRYGQHGFLILPLGFQVEDHFWGDFFFKLPPCDFCVHPGNPTVGVDFTQTLSITSSSPCNIWFP